MRQTGEEVQLCGILVFTPLLYWFTFADCLGQPHSLGWVRHEVVCPVGFEEC